MRGAYTALLLATALVFTALTAAFSSNFDFHAFYCAGAAVRMHADPYRTEPLATCERTRTDNAYAIFLRRAALPAPLPGYDLAGFSALAALPFSAASKTWSALLFAACLGAMLLARRAAGAAPGVAVAALWLSLSLPSIYLGEIVPLCVCAIAAAAFFLRDRRYEWAGAFACVSTIEPYIGLPVCAAIALWYPRSRPLIAIGLCVLGAAALTTMGLRENIEYARAVLPAHALSEITSDAQLSLSAILRASGQSAGGAVATGTAAYAALAALACVLGGTLARRFDNDAYAAAVPAAFAVTGGAFVHVTQIAAAIPLALLLTSSAQPLRPFAVLSLVLLSVPWWSLATPMLLGSAAGPAFAAITVAYLVIMFSDRPWPALFFGSAAFVCARELAKWYAAAAESAHSVPAAAQIPAIYPQAAWALENAREFSSGAAASWLLRAPTWCGLLLIVYCCVALAQTAPRRAALDQ